MRLDEIVCGGAADDVYLADQARLMLEELDGFVERINRTGIGKQFVANLQGILQRELILSLCRLYEPYSARNPGRSLPAATHHLTTHAAEIRVPNRSSLMEYLVGVGESRQALDQFSDERLSLTLAGHLDSHMPRADPSSSRPLDRALDQLKKVRDRAIAHHDQVSQASLLVPGWLHLVDLIRSARETVTLVAHVYVSVGFNLPSDASVAAGSLRRLLNLAGLDGNPDMRAMQ